MTRLYSALERQLALQKLEAWSNAARHRQERQESIAVFVSAFDDLVDGEQLAEGLANLNIQTLLIGWLYADAPLAGEPCAALSLLASSKGARLPAGSRKFLELLAASSQGIYEVLEVDRGRSCTVLDLLSDQSLVVPDPDVTQAMKIGDVVSGRLMPGGDGQPQFEELMLLPGDAADAREYLEEFVVACAASAMEAGGPGLDTEEGSFLFGKTLAPLIARLCFGERYGEPDERGEPEGELVPMIINDEPVEPGLAQYLLGHNGPGPEALAEVPGMEEIEPGFWAYSEECPEGLRRVGTVSIELSFEGRSLIELECPGRESMKRLRKAVKKAFGKSLVHSHTAYDPPVLVPPDRAGPFLSFETPIDPEEFGIDPDDPEAEKKIEHAFRQQHLQRWLDMPLPALDGATPRQAARRPEQRMDLIRLLRQSEASDHARAAHEGIEPVDHKLLWQELGLAEQERDGEA